VQQQVAQRPPGAVVVRAGGTGPAILFGIFLVVFVAGLAESLAAQKTASGKIGAAVFFGLFIVAIAVIWYFVNRARKQLEIAPGVIVSRHGVKGKTWTLSGGPGDTLRILPSCKVYNATMAPRLILLGTGGFTSLRGYSADRVARVCQEQGWRFDGDPARAARDVQSWLHSGLSVDAVQLLRAFGPFPAVASDGEPGTALEAAVYEDIGDKLIRTSTANARDAYQRAVAAQRVFTGYARSPDEGAARMAQASRIEAKLY
jgi:hypothetical protein